MSESLDDALRGLARARRYPLPAALAVSPEPAPHPDAARTLCPGFSEESRRAAKRSARLAEAKFP